MRIKPHVLMISTDHWPGALLGSAGNREVMTPTLDTLAQNGVRYDQFYSECPVCIPARRSMMTGLTPRTHGDRVYRDTLTMPNAPTLARTFREQGYQTVAVGKLHVYPQRDRIGFDEVILQEEGRCEFGVVDDYQLWLGDEGYTGQEFLHSMGNNTYYTRPWHLPEYTHPTNWATAQMMRQIKRRDPTRPGFFYLSYQFPHPPLVPLQAYLDMYPLEEISEPVSGDWVDGSFIMESMREMASGYSAREVRLARRAFYAQCTHIDQQIRLLIGTLRESGMLDDTLIVFTSDHGDVLFDHGIVAKRCFYEGAACVPLILSGRPVEEWRGRVDHRLGCMVDIMPTLLDICGLSCPDTVEGVSLVGEECRELIYGEVGEGPKATRMLRDERYKLIYYPYGNKVQLFDLEEDPRELHDLADEVSLASVRRRLEELLISHMYGGDIGWVTDGRLTGVPEPVFSARVDYGLYNQRGVHWPPPVGYANVGENA